MKAPGNTRIDLWLMGASGSLLFGAVAGGVTLVNRFATEDGPWWVIVGTTLCAIVALLSLAFTSFIVGEWRIHRREEAEERDEASFVGPA